MDMVTEVPAREVAPRTFPFVRANPCLPSSEYAELRATEPVARITLPTGHSAWLVTRHDYVATVLADPRFSRGALMAADAPRLLPLPPGGTSLFFMDPPEHSRVRQLLAHAFQPRSLERLRPNV